MDANIARAKTKKPPGGKKKKRKPPSKKAKNVISTYDSGECAVAVRLCDG